MAKCKVCRQEFMKRSISHKVCGQDCAQKYAETLRIASERKNLREARQRIKPRSKWLQEAQQAFNAYIRERDKNEPCISCGRHHQGQYHAGHYRTVGANPELRFEELNARKQCAPCNNHLSGNIVNYRINLIRKIGLEAVEWLEGNHEPKHYTIDELKQIKAEYKAKLKALET